MANTTYGAIKLATANDVGTVLKKKMGSQTGFSPKEWADTINLLGKLPTRTVTGTIAHFTDGADDVPIVEGIFAFNPIQTGTGDPSPSNPRPITGFSSVNVEQRGVNLSNEVWEAGTINDTTGQPTSSDTQIRTKDFCPCKGGVTYYVRVGSNNSIRVFWYRQDNSYIGQTVNISNATATAPSDACYFKMRGTNAYGTTYLNDISLNYPSTDTSYHAYKGQTHTLALGQEVFGGSVESVGSGEVTRVNTTVGSSGWSKYGTFFYKAFADKKRTTTADETPLISSMCVNGGTVTSSTNFQDGKIYQYSANDNIYIVDSTVASIDDFYTKYGSCQICYELATPQPLTFEGVEINSYYGVNNFYHDGNGDSTIEYRADIDILINELGG